MTVREWFRVNRGVTFGQDMDILLRFTDADVHIRDLHGIQRLLDDGLVQAQKDFVQRLRTEALVEEIRRDLRRYWFLRQIVA